MRQADRGALRAALPLLPLLLLLMAGPPALAAQAPRPNGAAPVSRDSLLPAPGEVRLVYDREVFTYAAVGRRDPFTPLIGEGLGPRFEDLSLRGIIYSPVSSRSVVLLGDPRGKIYRARQGDVVGNARVLSIQPLRVLFQVESFGVTAQEMLELKRSDMRGGRR